MLGLSPRLTVQLKPKDIPDGYRCYVQSTSQNRQLLANSWFLWECVPAIPGAPAAAAAAPRAAAAAAAPKPARRAAAAAAAADDDDGDDGGDDDNEDGQLVTKRSTSPYVLTPPHLIADDGDDDDGGAAAVPAAPAGVPRSTSCLVDTAYLGHGRPLAVARQSSVVAKSAAMSAAVAARYGKLLVPAGRRISIKDFVAAKGLKFLPGRGFYELAKTETVQEGKDIIIEVRTITSSPRIDVTQ
jgi:hypothetical protein